MALPWHGPSFLRSPILCWEFQGTVCVWRWDRQGNLGRRKKGDTVPSKAFFLLGSPSPLSGPSERFRSTSQAILLHPRSGLMATVFVDKKNKISFIQSPDRAPLWATKAQGWVDIQEQAESDLVPKWRRQEAGVYSPLSCPSTHPQDTILIRKWKQCYSDTGHQNCLVSQAPMNSGLSQCYGAGFHGLRAVVQPFSTY